jgi:GNAT superfamily N-acetyltransferase
MRHLTERLEIVKIGKATNRDCANLILIDQKVSQFPLPSDYYGKVITSKYGITFVANNEAGITVGFISVLNNIDWKPDEYSVCRLCVLPSWQRMGIGSRLVSEAAVEVGLRKKYKFTSYHPEFNCIPGDPDDITPFLRKNKFLCTGIDGRALRYGKVWDLYRFERDV